MKKTATNRFSALNPSRRDFLQVGALGGLGLTLDNYFRIKSAHADQKFYESTEGPAKSVINIFHNYYILNFFSILSNMHSSISFSESSPFTIVYLSKLVFASSKKPFLIFSWN